MRNGPGGAPERQGERRRVTNESSRNIASDAGAGHVAAAMPEAASPSAMAVYEAGLKRGAFLIQRCNGCSRHIFYPRVICPHCASPDIGWLEPGGAGTVYSTTVVRRTANKGGPYNVALIDLVEGVRLMSRVEGIAPEAVRIGMPVRLAIEVVNGARAPVFRPA